MQMVHDVVVGLEFCRAIGDTSRDDMSGFADNVSRYFAHLADGGLQLGRNCTRWELAPGQLGNVHGEVAGSLKVRGNAEASRQRSQISRDRLLARDQIDSSPVDVLAKDVDGRVTIDHALGSTKIGIEQSLGGLLNRMAHELSHLDKLIGDRIELVVIGVAHACSLPSAQAVGRVDQSPAPCTGPAVPSPKNGVVVPTAESFTFMDGGRQRGDSLQNGR
jgi:hypothetical protein